MVLIKVVFFKVAHNNLKLIQAIHDAEEYLADCKIQAEKAKEKLDKVKVDSFLVFTCK